MLTSYYPSATRRRRPSDGPHNPRSQTGKDGGTKDPTPIRSRLVLRLRRHAEQLPGARARAAAQLPRWATARGGSFVRTFAALFLLAAVQPFAAQADLAVRGVDT